MLASLNGDNVIVEDALCLFIIAASDRRFLKVSMCVCSCVALLHIRKLPALNAFARPVPTISMYLVRHMRRRLAIEAVQVDPDAEADLAATAGAASGAPAAASACGGPAGAPKAFDF